MGTDAGGAGGPLGLGRLLRGRLLSDDRTLGVDVAPGESQHLAWHLDLVLDVMAGAESDHVVGCGLEATLTPADVGAVEAREPPWGEGGPRGGWVHGPKPGLAPTSGLSPATSQ